MAATPEYLEAAVATLDAELAKLREQATTARARDDYTGLDRIRGQIDRLLDERTALATCGGRRRSDHTLHRCR